MLQKIDLTRKLSEIENILLKVAKSDVLIQEYNGVMTIYGSDFDENKFQVKLQTLQEYCTKRDGYACIRSVTDTYQNLKVQSP